MTQFDQSLEVGKDRGRITHLLGGINHRVIRIYGNPRHTLCETSVRRTIPLDGGSRIVATHGTQTGKNRLRIFPTFDSQAIVIRRFDVFEVLNSFENSIRHAKFFALIHVGCPSKQVKSGCQCSCTVIPVLFITETTHSPWLVMVAQVQTVPTPLSKAFLPTCQAISKISLFQGATTKLSFGKPQNDVLKLEDHIDFAPRGIGIQVRVF